MPLEIREIVIRTVVGGDAPSPPPPQQVSQDGSALPGGLSFDQLVQECVRQVMQALARERER
jgi:Family of unknown function (DUF5908)